MYNSIIIATKDRYLDLIKCLQSLREQNVTPDEIIIVDSSENLDDKIYLDNLLKEIDDIEIKYFFTTKRGSSVQRNIGIDNLNDKSQIVFFFDDDIVLELDFIAKINEIYLSDKKQEIGGIDGYPLIDGKYKYKRNLNFQLIQMDSLYGCASFRKEALEDIRYDENLLLYAWMEDWDFSFRIGQKYKLYRHNQAYLYHYHSSSGRVSERKFGFVQIANRYYLYKKNNVLKFKDYIYFIDATLRNFVRSFRKTYRERFIGNIYAIYKVILIGKNPKEDIKLVKYI